MKAQHQRERYATLEVLSYMDRSEVVATILSLALPATDYVVVGGAAMIARGLRDTDDIDLVVTPELFARLTDGGWSTKIRPNGKPGLRKGCVEAYLDVNTPGFECSTPWLIENSERLDGIPFVDLNTLAEWKRTYGRPKDARDIAILEAQELGSEPFRPEDGGILLR